MDTTTFLARVRQATQLPTDDEDWTDDEILLEGTQALYERFSQAISVLRNGYWLHRITSSLTAGTSVYRLPPRAIVQGLEKLEISVDGGNKWFQISILTDSEATDFSNASNQGTPSHFSLESDNVVFYPTPSSPFSLRMSYYLRPSQLVMSTEVGAITSFNSTTIVCASAPNVGTGPGTIDIVNTTGCNEVAVVAMPYVSRSTGTFTIAAGTDISRLIVGQVVTPPDQTDQIPLPIELHGALVSWTSAVILLDKGDSEKAGQLASKAESAVKRIVDAAVPRVKTKPYEFRSRNTYLRRRAGFGGKRGWR